MILGIAAFLVMRRGDAFDRLGMIEASLASLSLVLGVVAMALAETAAAEAVLAVFMVSILVVWAVELTDHAGILPGTGHPTGLTHA